MITSVESLLVHWVLAACEVRICDLGDLSFRSTEDMENKSTKKQSNKFIKSLNVAIHAGEPGAGGSSRFFLAIRLTIPL